MKGDLEKVISKIFQTNGSVLGTIERNTEVRFVFLTLWALGWDPVREIACGFHIPRDKIGNPAGAANAIDFALREDSGVCVIGEAKQWFVKEKDWDLGLKQLQRYQRAVPVRRAFLTSGKRWLILNEDGKLLDDVTATDGGTLIKKLSPYLEKGKIEPNKQLSSKVWEYGISPLSNPLGWD